MSERYFWSPGAFVPFEAVNPHWKESAVLRWPVHVNAKVGEPSQELILAAGIEDVRVLVSTATAAWYPKSADRRSAAIQLLQLLPAFRQVNDSDRATLDSNAGEPSAWLPSQMEVGGEVLEAESFALDQRIRVTSCHFEDNVVAMAVFGPTSDDIQIQHVRSWNSYGIDLDVAQFSSGFAALAQQVKTSWEGHD